MQEMGMTRYKLAQRTGISYNRLMDIERGDSTSTRLLEEILNALDLDVKIISKETHNINN